MVELNTVYNRRLQFTLLLVLVYSTMLVMCFFIIVSWKLLVFPVLFGHREVTFESGQSQLFCIILMLLSGEHSLDHPT